MADTKRDYLEKYNDVNVPTGVHVGFKIWFFQIVDLGVVMGSLLLANKITEAIPMLLPFKLATYVVVLILAIFMVVRMPYNPVERNFKVIWYAIKYHRHRYWPVSVQQIPRKEAHDDD